MSASAIRRPFSESSPNVSRQTIFSGSPKKPSSSKDPSKKLKQANAGSSSPRKKMKKVSGPMQMKHKQKKQKSKSSLSQKSKGKVIPAVESGGVSKDPRSKKVPRGSRGGSVITKAAIRRIAAKHDIAQISSETVRLLADYLTAEANECLLKARSSALHVSRRKTVGLQDLACAAKSCKFGELVCA